jgi:hypothetical protein
VAVKNIFLKHFDLCLKDKIHHGFILGWMMVNHFETFTDAASRMQDSPQDAHVDHDFNVAMMCVCNAIDSALHAVGNEVWPGFLFV